MATYSGTRHRLLKGFFGGLFRFRRYLSQLRFTGIVMCSTWLLPPEFPKATYSLHLSTTYK